MQYFLTSKVVRFIAGRLDGKKTIIGGVGMILLGLAGIVGWLWPDTGIPPMDFDKAAGYIVGGFGVLGIGGKIEKLR